MSASCRTCWNAPSWCVMEQAIHAYYLPLMLQTAEASGTVMNVSLDESRGGLRTGPAGGRPQERSRQPRQGCVCVMTDGIFNYKVRQLGVDWKRFKV